jgi:hypothetical protein
MELSREQTKEEPARRGAWTPGWSRTQRGQEASQSRQWSQRGSRQKPQEGPGRAPQRPAPAPWTPQAERRQKVGAVIAAIRSRHGASAIGFGVRGIRYARRAGRTVRR